MNDPKIEVRNVSKIFGKSPQQGVKMLNEGMTKKEILEKTGMTVGVNKASFKVYAGEIFVIMGLSGSGKSTLVRMFNRLIDPTSGEVLIDGQDIVKMKPKDLREVRRTKLGMVFQKFALFPHRTVLSNTEYGLEMRGIDKKTQREKAMEALRLVGLEGYENSYPSELSGGMQQRVGLARALANDPDILLMDEAFSALDPLIRKDMQNELLELQEKMEKTIIFITHDLNEALRIGDRIALMKDGKIIQIGTGEEILTNPANDYVKTFLEDVDRSKVLTVENAMIRPITVNIELDGPKVALQRMREEEVSVLLAIDKKREFKGYITADDALEAAKRGEKSVVSFLKTDMPTVPKDMLIQDVLGLISESPTPIAVVNENKLVGVLIRGVVIQSLASENEGVTKDE